MSHESNRRFWREHDKASLEKDPKDFAFFPNDHVHVCGGPHTGSSGVVLGNLKESRHVLVNNHRELHLHPPEHLHLTYRGENP